MTKFFLRLKNINVLDSFYNLTLEHNTSRLYKITFNNNNIFIKNRENIIMMILLILHSYV